MKKLSIFFILLLVSTVIFCYQYKKQELKLNSAIHDSMASSYLYALDNNNTNALETMLVSKLISLIYDYDKNIYASSRNIKLTLCKDIPKYHSLKIQLYLQGDAFKMGDGKVFRDKILSNLELIEKDFCVKYKKE